MPFARLKPIVESTRAKGERTGYEKRDHEFRETYGDEVLGLQPQVVRQSIQLVSAMASNPVEFAVNLITELSSSPQYASLMRSHVAKVLASRGANGGGSAPAAEDPEPPPDITVDGYSWYSAAQQAKRDQWLMRQVSSQFDERLAPLQQFHRETQEQQQVLQAVHAANDFATRTLADMSRYPYFTEKKPSILKRFQELPPMPDQLVGQAIRDVYIQVLMDEVLPGLPAQAKSELLSTLNQKAAASSANPAAGAVAVAGRPKSFAEALHKFGATG